jgi:hypothetical protein
MRADTAELREPLFYILELYIPEPRFLTRSKDSLHAIGPLYRLR